MSLKAVLFDFGGTLDSNGIPWLDRFRPLYRTRGIRASPEEFAGAFYRADDGLSSKHRLSGLGLEETVRLQVRDVLAALEPSRVGDAESIARSFVEESRRHIDRVRPLLARLRERYRLAAVSNFYGNLDSVLDGEGLREYFTAAVDSTAVGCLKPDALIFRRALAAVGARPAEALMVGDSVERDMRGAERLGMAHAWLRGPRPAGAACCGEARVLGALEGLEACLQDAATAEARS